MALDPNTLYPEGYVELEPVVEPPPPDDAAHGRDITWLRDVAIPAAVPVGGDPLTIAQLVELVCGTQWNLIAPAINVIGNRIEAIAEVQLPRDQRTLRINGPDRTASLLPAEVEVVIREVMDARRATWTELP